MSPAVVTRLEQAAIEAAEAYARVNGFGNNRTAAGLVLVGMTIAAGLSPDVARAIAEQYLVELPASRRTIASWIRYLEAVVPPTERTPR